ncbi:hypothetical protein BaRGS_00000864 [Batillaria attramentaria]|uniref:Uncharacterized protein n=1 Tax=Batillaria attramentaria TaxID=370345 RepID=A0ABD0M7V2_9CAEN
MDEGKNADRLSFILHCLTKTMCVTEGPGPRQQWGGPADTKLDSWGRSMDGGDGGANDRWMGSSSMGGPQHQRSGGGTTSYGGHGAGVSSSGVGGGMYVPSGPPQSSNLIMGGSGMSRQQDNRFNIAAITARRF